MLVAFQTKKLRRVCEDESVASAMLGPTVAAQLRERLADIRAASTTDDLLVGSPRVGASNSTLLTIDLGPNSHMTWTANHVTPRTNEDGDIDWSRVTRIRLLKIERL